MDCRWWPETLLYIERYNSTFEVFARCASQSYLSRVLPVLGIETKEDLRPLLQAYESRERQVPRWQFDSFNPGYLIGYERLGTET